MDGLLPDTLLDPTDGYAWDGWPTYPENYYMDPVSWWAQHMFVILKVYPTGRAPTKEALPKPGEVLPPTPEDLIEAISAVRDDVAVVKTTVDEVSAGVSGLSGDVEALAGQLSSLTMAMGLEAVVIVILAIGMVVSLRKRS